jgi:hypothetical protein
MLSAEVSGKVSEAIKEARAIAREIARRVETSGELAADVVRDMQTRRLDSARLAFLDFEEGTVETQAPAGRGLDLEPNDAPASMNAAPAQQFFLEV